MKKHTNLDEEIYHEEAPLSWLNRAAWLAPFVLLIGYIVYRSL